jgi:hypothetical protein
MDLNELVVQQIINSEREKISDGFEKRLEKALSIKEKELDQGYQSKINSITKELEDKNDSISKLLEIQAENEKLKEILVFLIRK